MNSDKNINKDFRGSKGIISMSGFSFREIFVYGGRKRSNKRKKMHIYMPKMLTGLYFQYEPKIIYFAV